MNPANDRLIRNEWTLRGEPVNLSRIRGNLLTVIAEDDRITSPSKAIKFKVSSKHKELFIVPGGHIGIMAGSAAHKRTWPHIEGWLAPRSRLASACITARNRLVH